MDAGVSNHSGSPHAGSIFLLGMGVFLALLGGFFVWIMAASSQRARESRAWPEVPCVILVSEIEDRLHDPQSPVEYRHNIFFGYEWDGVARTSDRNGLRDNPWTSKRDVVTARATALPEGAQTTCRVDPDDPAFAILEPDSMAPLYSIWFPGVFVLGGVVMAARAAMRLRGAADSGCRDVRGRLNSRP